MLALHWIELTCPVCETIFETMSADASESGCADGLEVEMGLSVAQALPYLVHVCRRCGYAGDVEAFLDEIEITSEVRDRVWTELSPALAVSVRIPYLALTAPGSEKYEGAAMVAEWRAARALTVAELWIRAAQCAIHEGDLEAERYYARFAARWFAEALERDEVAFDERAIMLCGLGELWLHLGDVRAANSWFKRVTAEAARRRGS